MRRILSAFVLAALLPITGCDVFGPSAHVGGTFNAQIAHGDSVEMISGEASAGSASGMSGPGYLLVLDAPDSARTFHLHFTRRPSVGAYPAVETGDSAWPQAVSVYSSGGGVPWYGYATGEVTVTHVRNDVLRGTFHLQFASTAADQPPFFVTGSFDLDEG